MTISTIPPKPNQVVKLKKTEPTSATLPGAADAP